MYVSRDCQFWALALFQLRLRLPCLAAGTQSWAVVHLYLVLRVLIVLPAVSVYNSAQLSQGQAWQIDRLELNTMNYTFGTSGSSQNSSFQQAQLVDLNSDGVQFVIHISRTSK